MFLPLHDDTPLRVIRFQFVTLAIIVLNVAIYGLSWYFFTQAMQANIENGLGLIPANLFQISTDLHVPEPLTLITYLFLHGGWLHLFGNMIFLWVFADNIEDAFGYFGFVAFYLLCGIAGGLLHVLMLPNSHSPLIGASAAVSGVLAAYLVLYPRARVWILLFIAIPVPMPAIWVLGGWFLLQVYSLASAASADEVAWWAHMGGFATGIILTLALRPRIQPRQPRPNGRN
jgi:membrane associated rhomboid family serine protease